MIVTVRDCPILRLNLNLHKLGPWLAKLPALDHCVGVHQVARHQRGALLAIPINVEAALEDAKLMPHLTATVPYIVVRAILIPLALTIAEVASRLTADRPPVKIVDN